MPPRRYRSAIQFGEGAQGVEVDDRLGAAPQQQLDQFLAAFGQVVVRRERRHAVDEALCDGDLELVLHFGAIAHHTVGRQLGDVAVDQLMLAAGSYVGRDRLADEVGKVIDAASETRDLEVDHHHVVTAKDIPVIIFSNLGEREEIEKALSQGAAQYLVKSSTLPGEVIDAVQKQLGIARAEGS